MAGVTRAAIKIKQGLVLTCTKDLVKNFLDPYPFWNFEGKTKCAGCGTIYAMHFVKGQLVSGPTESSGQPDLLRGTPRTRTLSRCSARARSDPHRRPAPTRSAGSPRRVRKASAETRSADARVT